MAEKDKDKKPSFADRVKQGVKASARWLPLGSGMVSGAAEKLKHMEDRRRRHLEEQGG